MTRAGDDPRRPVRIGTRGSELARTQSGWVAKSLEEAGLATVLETVRTAGDRDPSMSLARSSHPGVFTAALDEALLEGSVDLAVHSLKDLPTEIHPDLEIVSIPPREEAADVLVLPEGRQGHLRNLSQGARIGTSSPRRQALCLAYRPDLRVEPIRGNVDTRLGKVDAGEYDAAIMALAGLRRMGRPHRASEAFEVREWPPAPGQGALAVVGRRDDPFLQGSLGEVLTRLESPATRAAVEAERSVLHALGAGCSLPVAAVGLPYQDRLRLWAMVLSADGREVIRTDRTGTQKDAGELGRDVAEVLRKRGADRVLAEMGSEGERGRGEAPPPPAAAKDRGRA